MDTIRIGVAGLGGRGRWWARLIDRVPGYRVTALYDYIRPLHAQALAGIQHPEGVKSYYEWEEFLASADISRKGAVMRQEMEPLMAASSAWLAASVCCKKASSSIALPSPSSVSPVRAALLPLPAGTLLRVCCSASAEYNHGEDPCDLTFAPSPACGR